MVTLATGTASTVTDVFPDLPSLVAVIVTDPEPTPVTTPDADTVATAALLVDHVTTRSVTTIAVDVAHRGAELNVRALHDRRALRLHDDRSDRDVRDRHRGRAALAFARRRDRRRARRDPGRPRPDADTVATPAFELDHVTARPFSTLPAASFSVAVSCVVCPTDIESGVGVTVTVATAACETVIVADAALSFGRGGDRRRARADRGHRARSRPRWRPPRCSCST